MARKRHCWGHLVAAVCLFAACVCLLAGCGTHSDAPTQEKMVRVGTMPTEDTFPFWVAESEAMQTDDGVRVEVVSFDSAQALSAAISSGDVDMAMTDIMRAAKLSEAGTEMTLEWTALGEDATQGRFGILAAPDAPYDSLPELAAWVATQQTSDIHGVGVGANTVPEYVFDRLCEEADIAPDAIPVEEVASLPERYSLMASGQLLAAALPGSLVEFGTANGMKLLADDTRSANISQSVIAARTAWADEHPELVEAAAELWDRAQEKLAIDPAAYRALLVELANINDTIAESYPLPTYPHAEIDGALAHPAPDMVSAVTDWMRQKGYGGNVSYDGATGRLSAI